MLSQGSWVGYAGTCPSDSTTSRGWSLGRQHALAPAIQGRTNVKCQCQQLLLLACKVRRFIFNCRGEALSSHTPRKRTRQSSRRECYVLLPRLVYRISLACMALAGFWPELLSNRSV